MKSTAASLIRKWLIGPWEDVQSVAFIINKRNLLTGKRKRYKATILRFYCCFLKFSSWHAILKNSFIGSNYCRSICSGILNVMLFGVSVVYLLLAAHIINDFVTSIMGHNIGFCFMIVVLAFVLHPITLLKSPQDFWLFFLL